MARFTPKSLIQQSGFGLSAALLIFAYALCTVAVLGQGLELVLFVCVACAVCSLLLKNEVFSTNLYLIVPLFFVFTNASAFAGILSACLGGLIFLIISKLSNKPRLPVSVIAGGALGLSLAGTILLTNTYFGIGATGSTPFEMLQSYRSLGFHPHFMGLLTGTITLFTMITYPFKFKKLNKYIPAEFITILIPYIINLFLNPVKELTAINETGFFNRLFTDFNLSSEFFSISPSEITTIMQSSFAIALILLGFSSCSQSDDAIPTAIGNIFSGLSVKKYDVRGYGIISCIVVILVTTLTITIFPHALARVPLHSVGAMLIVSGWQTLPYKKIGAVVKSKSFLSIIAMLICAISFVLCNIFSACIVCIICAFLLHRFERSGKSNG